MEKLISIVIIGLSMFSSGLAQDYKTGIGLRGDYFNGLTVKHFIASKAAIEGILSSRWQGFQVTGLYESTMKRSKLTG